MKKKLVMAVLIMILVVAGTYFKVTDMQKNITTDNVSSESSQNPVCYAGTLKKIEKRGFSSSINSTCELGCTNEEIVDLSSSIVRGKISKIIGAYDYVCEDYETGEEIHSQRYLYEFEREDVLKGEVVDDIKISMPAAVEETQFEIGKEYVWCLQRLKNDYDGAYQCVSYSQGLFDIEGDTLARNGNHDDTISMHDFKSLIKMDINGEYSDNDKSKEYKAIKNSREHREMFEE